jgi:cobalamin biosynthesis protein CobW
VIMPPRRPARCPVIEVGEGAIDPRVILGLGAAAEDDLANRPSHHDGHDDHDHEDFDSVVVRPCRRLRRPARR